MFKHTILGTLVTLTIVITTQSFANAQEHLSYCEGVKSTAEILKCVNYHLEDAQTRLGMAFQELAKSAKTDEDKELIQDAQNYWLSYRDAQCELEKKQSENPGFERIYELSCLATMTEQRAEQLSMSLFNSNRKETREFGTFPRWMNVLAHENPDIFWRYGYHHTHDMDCDGKNEHVISGIKITSSENNADENQTSYPQLSIIIAIAENPATGKPETQIIPIPATGSNNCKISPLLDLTFISEDSTEKLCGEYLVINKNKCGQHRINLKENMYDLF